VNGPEVAAVGQEIKVDGVGGFQALQRMRDAGCGWKYIATRGREFSRSNKINGVGGEFFRGPGARLAPEKSDGLELAIIETWKSALVRSVDWLTLMVVFPIEDRR